MPFKKGMSGNAKGRPKAVKYVSEALREILDSKHATLNIKYTGDEENSKTIRLKTEKNIGYAVATVLVLEALDGNIQAIKEVLDRAEGKVKDSLDLNARVQKVELHTTPQSVKGIKKLTNGS